MATKNIVISEIQVLPIKPKNGLVAFSSCVFNSQLYIGNIAIFTTPDGRDFRLSYPTKMLVNGKVTSCIHPINYETGETIRLAIIKAYRSLLEKIHDNGMNIQGRSNEDNKYIQQSLS